MEPYESEQPRRSHVGKYSVVGGVLSAVLVATSYWETGSEVSVTPILFVTLALGYVAEHRSSYTREVGARAGLIGGTPILWGSYDLAVSIVEFSNPTWFTPVSLASLAGFVLLIFGATALLGELGGRTGRWLVEHRGTESRTAHGHQ